MIRILCGLDERGQIYCALKSRLLAKGAGSVSKQSRLSRRWFYLNFSFNISHQFLLKNPQPVVYQKG